MREIALDVDGVLADFNHGFIALANQEGLGEHFPKSPDEIKEWYYSDRELINKLFAKVITNDKFWLELPGYKNTPVPLGFVPKAYITARPCSSDVTARWLKEHGFPKAPVYTVKDGEDKLEVLRKLGSPIFVDDKMETVQMLNDNGLVCYCMDRGWNQTLNPEYPRIRGLEELLNG